MIVQQRIPKVVADDTGRIAMYEECTEGSDGSDAVLTRYIYSNHLGSASLELDGSGEIISYEEYHPYGTTAYQAESTDIDAVAKRYRYTGKERDEETGLYYHGARYYIPWLARWCATDPLQTEMPLWSPYNYGFCNPVVFTDPSGNQPENNINPENTKFLNEAKNFLNDEVQRVENNIKRIGKRVDDRYQEGKDFLQKKFGAEYDKISESLKDPQSKEEFISNRIDAWFYDEYKASGKFEQQKQLSELKELSDFFSNSTFTDEVLTLGSVIRNKAGSSSQIAKEAIGHGWLNRTKDIIREPKGAEISHYQPLAARMNSYSNASEKINFLISLKNSIKAADTVLDIENRSQNDPTEGATHWISPMANLFNAKSGGNTQERIINGKTRFVPEWARANSDTAGIAKMQKEGRLMNNYKEVNIFNNTSINYDFLFYRGVR